MSETTESTELAPVVLSTNEKLRTQMENYAEWYREALQAAYLAYVALALGDITLTELDRYNVSSAERLVREKMYEGNPAFKALPFEKEKAMALMELPPTLGAFKAAMEQLRKVTARRSDPDTRKVFPPVNHFAVEKGQVVPRPSLSAWINVMTLDRLTDPKQIKAYRDAEKLVRQIRDFEEEHRIAIIPHPGDAGLFKRGVIVKGASYYDRDTVDYSDVIINEDRIKSIQ